VLSRVKKWWNGIAGPRNGANAASLPAVASTRRQQNVCRCSGKSVALENTSHAAVRVRVKIRDRVKVRGRVRVRVI